MEEVEQIAEYVGVVESGKLLMESRLDDIKSNFRLITVSGNCLPTQTSSEVLSVDVEGNFYRYVIAKDAEFFAATLSRNGATITNIAHLSLREIFLQTSPKGKVMYLWKCWRGAKPPGNEEHPCELQISRPILF
jgi:ABC-2 type transport system ATP-binding protein